MGRETLGGKNGYFPQRRFERLSKDVDVARGHTDHAKPPSRSESDGSVVPPSRTNGKG